jgi:hypothetical protein
VDPTRLSGVWRGLEAMPPLLQGPSTLAIDRTWHPHSSGAPGASAGPAHAAVGEEGQQDLVRELVAVAGMDDVHLCRVSHAKEPGAPSPYARLSRLFSLDISKV